MIACIDVDCREIGAVAACILFSGWCDDRPEIEVTVRIEAVEPYEPGYFYRRELPCLLAVLDACERRPDVIIIDGYVWLAEEQEPGLGAHLYEALGRQAAVVGVAKSRFQRALTAAEVLRGESLSPLYVTAAGMDAQEASARVREMHGPFRIPTLLKKVDQSCREWGREA